MSKSFPRRGVATGRCRRGLRHPAAVSSRLSTWVQALAKMDWQGAFLLPPSRELLFAAQCFYC